MCLTLWKEQPRGVLGVALWSVRQKSRHNGKFRARRGAHIPYSMVGQAAISGSAIAKLCRYLETYLVYSLILNHQKSIMPDFKAFSEPSNLTTYHGGCHCGKSRFTVTMPVLETVKVTSCNCSICEINGYMNVYPLQKNVVWESGYDELGKYEFGSKTRTHLFCKQCGTSILIDFSKVNHQELRNHCALNVSLWA